MSQLIFDLETFGYDFDQLDPVIQENFLKYAETDEERENIKTRTGLYPVSGEIVALAMINPATTKGKVFFQAPSSGLKNYEKDGVEYQIGSEKEILINFWQAVKNYQQIITFNGRGFDCPFIIYRSVAHGLKPSRNLMPNRYYFNEHLDLLEFLSFFGAFRKFSLAVMCQTFGIKNPKDEGVSGLAINGLFQNKEYKKIAEYCLRDVMATKELHQKIKDFIF